MLKTKNNDLNDKNCLKWAKNNPNIKKHQTKKKKTKPDQVILNMCSKKKKF